ncbi:unnamed protein product [Rotaria magnacalcarata]
MFAYRLLDELMMKSQICRHFQDQRQNMNRTVVSYFSILIQTKAKKKKTDHLLCNLELNVCRSILKRIPQLTFYVLHNYSYFNSFNSRKELDLIRFQGKN